MSGNIPQFSIIIPTYNRGYCVARAIESVQAQTLDDWELLVVDDGSTDNTREVVDKIIQGDSRVRLRVLPSNVGVSAARNFGWQEATGGIVVYLDSDDTFFPTLLEKIAQVFDDKPNTIFGMPNHYRHIVLVDKDKKVLQAKESFICHAPGTTLQDVYFWVAKVTGSGIFHKKVVDSRISWDENLKRGEDWDFILQCGRLYAEQFAYVPEPLVYYTQKYGTDGICANTTYAEWAEMFENMYQKHKDDPLLDGQTWYPERIGRYTKMQAQVEAGEIPPAMYKYFPNAIQK